MLYIRYLHITQFECHLNDDECPVNDSDNFVIFKRQKYLVFIQHLPRAIIISLRQKQIYIRMTCYLLVANYCVIMLNQTIYCGLIAFNYSLNCVDDNMSYKEYSYL